MPNGVRTCSSAHCSINDPQIYEICRQLHLPAGYPVLSNDGQGPCTCSCSCLAFGTMVQSGDESFKAIETYAIGDEVLASGLSSDWRSAEVVFSSGTQMPSRQKDAVLVLYGSTAIAVTRDHLFVTRNEEGDTKVTRADRLTTEDNLVSPENETVPIRSVHLGDYISGFHNIVATSLEVEDSDFDLEGHVINSNGVRSVDYLGQLYARQGDVPVPGFNPDEQSDRLVVGTPEYVDRYGSAVLEAPELPTGFQQTTDIEVASFNTSDVDKKRNVWVPAAALKLKVPPEAAR